MSEARGTSGELPLLARGLADLDHCMDRWLDLDAAGHGRAVELHQLHQQVGAAGRAWPASSNACLAPTSNGATWAMRIDQHFVVEPADRIPVDRQAHRVAEPPRFALDLGALGERQRRRLAVVESLDVDVGAAVGRVDLSFAEAGGNGSCPAARC